MNDDDKNKKNLRWPLIIVGLLSVHVIVSLFFVYVATSNPSFAVEEDYYQKALKWDEKRAQDSINQSLGWLCEASLESATTPGGPATVSVDLHDDEGSVIDDAMVTVECFALARSGRVLRETLTSIGNGEYEADIDARRPGLWEIRIRAERAEQLFTFTERTTFTTAIR